MEFDLFAWTGQGTASQNWSIAVVEQRKTYFGVRKSAAQTITVGGTGASLVTRHTSGTVDGSAIGDTLNVFTVDTSAFDLMFLGGSRSFTLTVSEAGKESVTVNVTVSVRPYKTGVAVFKVTRPVGDPGITKEMTPAQAEEWAVSGSLERVPPEDIKEWKFPEKSTDLGYWGEAQGARLLDALAWVDQDPEKSGEYLIRVEKSEALPPCQLTSKKTREDAGEDVTIRLRSAGGEQIISFNGDNAITGRYYNSAIYIYASSPDGLINLNQGHEGAGSRDYGMLTLGLEKNISLRGFRRAGDHGVRNVLRLNNFSKLVMLEGSKIYGHDADGSYSSEVIYCYYVKNSLLFNPLPPGLYMFGGAIMDNLTAERGTVFFSTFRINHVFVKKGGDITGNTYKGQPHNKITFYSDSPEGRILEIEPDVEYSYPDFNEE